MLTLLSMCLNLHELERLDLVFYPSVLRNWNAEGKLYKAQLYQDHKTFYCPIQGTIFVHSKKGMTRTTTTQTTQKRRKTNTKPWSIKNTHSFTSYL